MLWFGIFVGLLLSIGASSLGEVDLPELDLLLTKVQITLRQEGKDTMKLSDLKEPFAFGKVLKGEFSASEGALSDIATIQRLGLVSMTKELENKVSLNISIKFDPLEFFYKNYRLKYLTINSVGSIKISRPESVGTIIQTILKNEDSTCSYTTDFTFHNSGKVNTELTGTKLPDQFLPFVNSWILHSFSTNEVHGLMETVKKAITENLESDGSLCKNLFG